MTEPEKPGDLDMLQRQLYARDESALLKNRSAELQQLRKPKDPAQAAAAQPTASVAFTSIARERARRRRRIFLIAGAVGLLLLLLVGAVAGTLWYRVRHNVTEEQIGISLTAPTEFTAGSEITYTFEYRNDSFVDWNNVEISFEPPPGFTLTRSSRELTPSGKRLTLRVGQLASGAAETLEIVGRLIGEQNASVVAQGELVMTPVNFPSGRFSRSALATTAITAMPIDVSVAIAKEAAAGERVLATIQVTNTSNQPLTNAFLKITAAPGVQLAVEDPQFSPDFSVTDKEWTLPELAPLASTTREAILFIQGQPGEQREVQVAVGVRQDAARFVQRKVSSSIAVAASQLTLAQTYNGATSPVAFRTGETLRGVITYTNTGTVGLRDVIVRANFEGTGLDPATLSLRSGGYDAATRTVAWTAATVPELALVQPQQSGKIEYEFSLLKAAAFPASDGVGKNNALIITTRVDSPDLTVPVGQERSGAADRFVASVTTDLTLTGAAFYDDGRLGIPSTGPVPPRVGDTTTYTIRLQAGSTLNDVGDVRVVAVLPDGVKYTGQVVKTLGEVVYNDRTGELAWSMPQLAGLTGRTAPTADLYFQVSITPGEHQRDDDIDFLNRLIISGTDLFTDAEVNHEVTDYPTTNTAVPNKGYVE